MKHEYQGDFPAFWLSGPWRKLGRKAAEQHFCASVKTEADWKAIQGARDAYLEDLRAHPRSPQHGSTWFNNWRDWLEEGTELLKDETPVLAGEAERLAKAELILTDSRRQASWWEINKNQHRHDAQCQNGKVCRYSGDGPKVPELSEILERMR